MSWNEILQQRQAKYPSELVVRFVARNYYDAPNRAAVYFLDLGCGAQANANFLRNEGFSVITVDSAPEAKAHTNFNIGNPEEWPDKFVGLFDCVLDFNTLCHIGNPPVQKIIEALKPVGKFFSVCPADDTWRGHLVGKGFFRLASEKRLRQLYHGFSDFQIGYACYPDRGHKISSWVMEATR